LCAEHSKAIHLILNLNTELEYRKVLSLGELPLSPYPINDFHLIDCVAIGLGIKSRFPIDYPSAWQVSGVGRAFIRPNPLWVVRRVLSPPTKTKFVACHPYIREAKVETTTGPASPQQASTFRVRQSCPYPLSNSE
jgi:hypothetical protein